MSTQQLLVLNQIHAAQADRGLAILAVLHEERVDDDALLTFIREKEIRYHVVRADATILKAYKYPNAVPATFVYDRQGRLVDEHRGPLSADQLTGVVNQARR